MESKAINGVKHSPVLTQSIWHFSVCYYAVKVK